jgi:multidrug efflux pump subunit AcrB
MLMASSRSWLTVLLILGGLGFVFCCAGVVGVGSWLAYRFGPDLLGDTETRPTLRITARYDGASAKDVEDHVVLPIEAQLFGMEGLESVESISGDDTATIILYLSRGTDMKMAQVVALNRLNLALPMLPNVVKRNGTLVRIGDPLPALWLFVTTPDGSRDELFLRKMAHTELTPELASLGLQAATGGLWHEDSLRYRLDPRKLAAHNLSPQEVEKALPKHRSGFLDDVRKVDPFLDTVVGADKEGHPVRLKEVAEIAWTDPQIVVFANWHGANAVTIAVEGRDSAAAVSAVEQHLPALQKRLPAGTELHLLPGPAASGSQGIIVDGQLPVGASTQRLHVILRELATDLAKLSDARAANVIPAVLTLPTQEPATFRLYIALCPAGERASTNAEIEAQVRELVARRADLAGRVISPIILARPPLRRAPVVVSVRGPGLEEVTRLADTIRDRLNQCEAVTNVWAEYPRFVPQTWIDVDPERARAFGLSMKDVLDLLPVVNPTTPEQWEDFENLKLHNGNGSTVLVRDVARLRRIDFPKNLQRIDGERRLLITAHPAAGVSVEQARSRSLEIAQQAMRDLKSGEGYQVECTGGK